MTPAEAGTGAVDAPGPAAPALPGRSARAAATRHAAAGVPHRHRPGRDEPAGRRQPAPVSATDGPLRVSRPPSERVVLARGEVQELCDVLWRAERALCARGWQRLGRAAGGWVAVLEERLWATGAP